MSYQKLSRSEPENEVQLSHVEATEPSDTYRKLGSDEPDMEGFDGVQVSDVKARAFDGFDDTNRSPLLKGPAGDKVQYEVREHEYI